MDYPTASHVYIQLSAEMLVKKARRFIRKQYDDVEDIEVDISYQHWACSVAKQLPGGYHTQHAGKRVVAGRHVGIPITKPAAAAGKRPVDDAATSLAKRQAFPKMALHVADTDNLLLPDMVVE